MAYVSYKKILESKLDNIVFKKDNLQGMKINQIKLEVHDTYKRDEKITTKFEAVIDEDVINKAYLDGNLSGINGHVTLFETKKTKNLNYNITNNL